ncbi:hypothetical protein HDG34_003291 [Paraburkholderia sp. HC6.4b]|uniref:hypothetical protein n=1 Tax=unclassified Paraburkholderia TaxID=2615204 RepID=UPI001620D52E|nr:MULTISPECIES: hypothetical protein [unclassified Paraburkholderia]MBB5409350.1 hypothetical protein [Paraburkholderia sp. HC6.4b]MBB5451078.1 hypothetical protein [Paraburkholderia sp. Kb1A]
MPENRKARSKTILDSRRLMLSAPLQGKTGNDGKKIWASLYVTVFANTPFITVFTNDPDDRDNDGGRISAEISPVEFIGTLIDFERVIAGPDGKENKRQLCNVERDRNPAQGEKPAVRSAFCYGKDEDGIVWVALSAKGRPNIRFDFGYSRYHFLQHKAGEQYSKAEASQLFALGWIHLVRQFVTDLMRTEYEHPQPQNDGGGKNNRGRASTSAKSHYAEVEEDDIPY